MVVKIIKSDEVPSTRGLTDNKDIFPVITKWQRYCELELTNKTFITIYDEVEELELYKRFGFDSVDEFMKEKVLVNYDIIASQIKEIAKRIKAGELDEIKPMPRRGGDRKSDKYKNQNVNNISIPIGRTNKLYIISRLKRDNPELAQQVLDNKISAHKASIKAGWGKRMITHPFTVEGFIKAINKLSDVDREELINAIINE